MCGAWWGQPRTWPLSSRRPRREGRREGRLSRRPIAPSSSLTQLQQPRDWTSTRAGPQLSKLSAQASAYQGESQLGHGAAVKADKNAPPGRTRVTESDNLNL